MKKQLLTGKENKNGLYGYLPGNDQEAGKIFKSTIMKKIFTLAFVTLFAMAVKADDHRPSVSVINNTNFTVLIDGREVYDFNGRVDIMNMNYGKHMITVVEEKRGLFNKTRIVATSKFVIDGNDRMVFVNVGRYGYISIDKSEFGKDNRGFDDRKGFDDKGKGKTYDWNDNYDTHRDNNDHGKVNDKPGKHF